MAMRLLQGTTAKRPQLPPEARPKQAPPTSLGIYDKPQRGPISGVEVAALVLSGL